MLLLPPESWPTALASLDVVASVALPAPPSAPESLEPLPASPESLEPPPPASFAASLAASETGAASLRPVAGFPASPEAVPTQQTPKTPLQDKFGPQEKVIPEVRWPLVGLPLGGDVG